MFLQRETGYETRILSLQICQDSLLTKIRSQLSKGISDDSNMSVSVFCAHALSETCSNADLWEVMTQQI